MSLMEYLVGPCMVVPLYGSRHPLCPVQLPTAAIFYSDSTKMLNILVDLSVINIVHLIRLLQCQPVDRSTTVNTCATLALPLTLLHCLGNIFPYNSISS